MPLNYCPKNLFWVENKEKITTERNQHKLGKIDENQHQRKINIRGDLKSRFL